jgi:ubiquinone/menaquinone biosynthesis C-methylase UbiE
MKHKVIQFIAGLCVIVVALFITWRQRIEREQIHAWKKQRRPGLDLMACPTCHQGLVVAVSPQVQVYHCHTCNKDYPVVDGIAHFIETETLRGLNKAFANLYDWFSWGYRAFSKAAFAYIGLTEEQGRRELTGRLDPRGGRVLEVSIGPGVNLPYLVGRADVGEMVGLDISLGQLRGCRAYVARRGWNVQLDLGNAENLPYAEDSFDSVFHIGGINFFNDKQKAIHEMIRVAKPGARILIADESEKGAQAYEKIIPGFKSSFNGKREAVQPPIDLVPAEMLERRVCEIWNGWFYCIEFRKP